MESTDNVLAAYLGIARRTPEEAVLRLLVELGMQFVSADEGSLLVLDRDANELVFAMTAGPAKSEKTLVGQRVPLGKGITGLAAATREVQIGAPTFKDIQQTERIGGEDQPAAVMASPMLINDELIGVITAVSFDPARRFTQSDASFFAKIASIAAVVVEQHRRLRMVEGIRRKEKGLKPISEDEQHRMKIIESVTRLTQSHPGQLAGIQSLMEAFDSIFSQP